MISIVIPAYNEEKYIEGTLKSLPKNVELIVVCNGCKDNTKKISKKYSRVYEIKERNVSKARNYGGLKTKGDKIIFLDADTKIGKNLLNKISNINDKYFFGSCMVKPDSNRISDKLYSYLKNFVGIIGIHNSSGLLFCSKALFNKVKFDELKIKRENQDFNNRARKYGKRYFLNGYSITSMRRFEKSGYINVLFYWIMEIFHKNKNYPSFR